MRRLPVMFVLAIASGALATPPPSVTWAEWVGDWDGKLKWSSCTIDGASSATFPVEATDGVVSIDLTNAGDALGPVSLVEDNGGWVGQQADVTVHLSRSHADALDIAIDLDSGCAVHATLKRPSTAIASCDRLDAWARIETRCTKLAKPPLENTARLVRQRAEWSRARGDARSKLATQCEARASKVEAALVDAGCAPNPDPKIGMRGAQCQALRRGAARFGRCSSLPSDLKSAIAREVLELLSAAQSADDAGLPVVESQCRDLRDRIVSAAQQASCPP